MDPSASASERGTQSDQAAKVVFWMIMAGAAAFVVGIWFLVR